MSPNVIETFASWQIPTAQNWGELTRLLVGPKQPCTIALSPDGSFFAVNPRTMNVLLSTAQNTIALGLNSLIAYGISDGTSYPKSLGHTSGCILVFARRGAPSSGSVFHIFSTNFGSTHMDAQMKRNPWRNPPHSTSANSSRPFPIDAHTSSIMASPSAPRPAPSSTILFRSRTHRRAR